MSGRLDRVYLDSSVLIGAVVTGANHAEAWQEFCRHQTVDRTTAVISTLSRYELAHLASVLRRPRGRRVLPASIIEEFNLANWSLDAAVRDRWMNAVSASLEALLGTFNDLAEIPVLPSLWFASIQIMIDQDLQSYDALDAATALSVDVVDFVTTDRQYVGIDGLNVHLARNQ